MDLNYKVTNIFPVPIHQFDVNGFDEIQNDLIDYAYEFKKNNPDGNVISNRGGWQSPDFSVNDEDDILHSFLINCLAGFPVIDKLINIKVDAWININKPGDFNNKHNHPQSDLAGVVWIKCPKDDCGIIVFDSPTSFQSHNEIQSYTDDFTKQNKIHHNFYFDPVEGRMLVFPAYLEHQVEINKSNEDRISVSFNLHLSKRMPRRGRVSIPKDDINWENE